MPTSGTNYEAVAISDDGSTRVVVVDNAVPFLSTDSGVNWAAQSSFAGMTKYYAASTSSDGSVIAVATDPLLYVTYNKGLNWYTR